MTSSNSNFEWHKKNPLLKSRSFGTVKGVTFFKGPIIGRGFSGVVHEVTNENKEKPERAALKEIKLFEDDTLNLAKQTEIEQEAKFNESMNGETYTYKTKGFSYIFMNILPPCFRKVVASEFN